MKIRIVIVGCMALALAHGPLVKAMLPTTKEPLPNYDKRKAAPVALAVPSNPARDQALAALKSKVPNVRISTDPILATPSWITPAKGFLSGPAGQGGAISPAFLEAIPSTDKNRVIKAFINEHSALLGHDATALAAANTTRDYTTEHNGMRTVVWEQTQDRIPVFEALLVAHVTRAGELVSVADHFVPNPALAAEAGTPNHAAAVTQPAITAAKALAAASANIGSTVSENSLEFVQASEDAEQKQSFKSPGLFGTAYVQLVWFPVNRDNLRLAWRVILNGRPQPDRYLVLVDAQNGEVLLRNSLNQHSTPATYNVYTSDSPSPFSPGWPTPNAGQPPLTNRVKVTLPALDTNASPQGWIPDSGNTTTGNNADAFVDRNLDFQPDFQRPQGANRVFNFPLDLTADPATYGTASTVQLFYRANWYHDRLYQLGFTEAAGNYQTSNFGRGGIGNDAIICLVQAGADVGYTDNSMFQPAPDGTPGICFMFVFDQTDPQRDGSLDQEIVIHELTHGTSNRLLGQGALISALQSAGMGEGWSDFYAMTMLSEATDDVNGNYAAGGYATDQFFGLRENYYYGIRRYPYTTDMSKNPLTFKDIDPTQADPHNGVPLSPIFGGGDAGEVHNQGEVWCVTLHEMWASLVTKFGWGIGNELSLRLVTDGLKLAPANATFLEARDGIIQADQIDTGGANYNEIWIAFAKRGMGYSAACPPSDTTLGVKESFDVPPDVQITAPDGILEVRVNPPASAALSGGDVVPIYVNVSDSFGVTNATITATINGTNLVFHNDGIAPDVFTNDSVYSASFTVPANLSFVTLNLIISAPAKEGSTNSVTYAIIPPPPNDFFTNAIKVPAAGAQYLTSNRKATIETEEPPHAGDPGVAASLWWNYSPLVSGNVLLDTGGSDDISILAIYTNSTLQTLQPVAAAIGTALRNGPYINLNAKAGVAYHIAVAGLNSNDVGTVRFAVIPGGVPDTNPPSVLVASPPSGLVVNASRLIVSGSAVDPNPNPSGIRSINVTVTSLPQGGSPITTSTTITPPVSADGPINTNWSAVVGLLEGLNTIRVSATDFAGNKSPQVTTLVTYRILDPPNDFLALATVLTNASDVIGGNTLNATKEIGEPNHAGNAGGRSAWWNFTAPADGALTLSTTNSTFDTLLGLYTGPSVGNLTTIDSNDDAYAGAPGGFSRLTTAVKANQTYHIAVDGYDGAGGALFLTYSFAPSQIYHLTVLNTAGGTAVPSSSDFPSNATVVLTATPNAGYQFGSWTGDVASTANPLTLTLTSNLTITAQFTPVVYTDGFESGNLSHLGWTSSGNTPWFVQTNVVASGSFAARSGAIKDAQSSSLVLTTNFTAGSGSFAYKVSSEPNFDVLTFAIDGVVVQQWSGEVDWANYAFPLTTGPHTLRWSYSKDASHSQGLDAAFIDNLNLPFGVPKDNTTPAHLQFVHLAGGSYAIDLTGQANQTYILQISTDLSNWQSQSTATASPAGYIRFTDLGGLTGRAQFYRAVSP